MFFGELSKKSVADGASANAARVMGIDRRVGLGQPLLARDGDAAEEAEERKGRSGFAERSWRSWSARHVMPLRDQRFRGSPRCPSIGARECSASAACRRGSARACRGVARSPPLPRPPRRPRSSARCHSIVQTSRRKSLALRRIGDQLAIGRSRSQRTSTLPTSKTMWRISVMGLSGRVSSRPDKRPRWPFSLRSAAPPPQGSEPAPTNGPRAPAFPRQPPPDAIGEPQREMREHMLHGRGERRPCRRERRGRRAGVHGPRAIPVPGTSLMPPSSPRGGRRRSRIAPSARRTTKAMP